MKMLIKLSVSMMLIYSLSSCVITPLDSTSVVSVHHSKLNKMDEKRLTAHEVWDRSAPRIMAILALLTEQMLYAKLLKL